MPIVTGRAFKEVICGGVEEGVRYNYIIENWVNRGEIVPKILTS